MERELIFKDGFFQIPGEYPDYNLKGKGFKYDPYHGVWWTRSHESAKLAGNISPEALKAFEQFDENIRDSKKKDSRGDFPVPEGLDYLPFQKAGIEFLLNHKNALLADSPGLGKTIQVIGLINADPTISRVLVLAPGSVYINWVRECKKWLTRKLRVEGFNVNMPVSLDKNTVVIMSYRRMLKTEPQLKAIEWDLLILDEAHYIKNMKAVRTTQIVGKRGSSGEWLKDPIRAKRKVLITGTPLLNRPNELWPYLNFLDSDNWWSEEDFYNRYCDAKETRQGLDNTGASNLDELNTRLRATVMLRRTKDAVLPELPTKIRHIYTLQPGPGAQVLSYELKKRFKTINYLNREDLLFKSLQQGDIDTVSKINEISELRRKLGVQKIYGAEQHIRELLATEEVKVVFFAHHKVVLETIYHAFRKQAVILTGETPLKNRQDAVDKFQNDPACRLFVGSMQAAGFGITLTAATHVVFGELDWVPSTILQCEDRCVRIGSKNSINIHYLVWQSSFESKIAAIITRKYGVIEATMRDKT